MQRSVSITVLLLLFPLLLTTSAGADEKPSLPQQDLIDFRAGYYDGCAKGQKALGKREEYQEAFCTCMVSILDELPEADLKVFMQRVQADASAALDPTFLDKLQQLGAADCPFVGQFDDTRILSKEEISQLREPKVLDGFSIRLPRGFMAFPVQQQGPTRVFTFGRLHGDLKSSTVIQVSIIDLGKSPPTEPTTKERQELLSMFLRGIKERRTEWAQSEPAEVELGGFRFAAVDWSGKTDGQEMEGTFYAAAVGSKLVALSAQDFRPFASDTIPLAKQVFKTFSQH